MITLTKILESLDIMEFIIIKPGFDKYINEIEQLLINKGFSIYKKLTRKLSLDEAMSLYKVHSKEDFYEDLCKYMSSKECTGYILNNRKGNDLLKLKDEIRKKYGKDDMRNTMHSSDSKKNVERESRIFFNFQ